MVSYCKYSVDLSPYYEEQSQVSMQWLVDVAQLSEKQEARYVAADFGHLASLVPPYPDVQRLRVNIDWMNYIFWVDDRLEVSDMEGIRRVEECFMAAMRDPVEYQTDNLAAIVTKLYIIFRRLIKYDSWFSRVEGMEQASSTGFKERYMKVMKSIRASAS